MENDFCVLKVADHLYFVSTILVDPDHCLQRAKVCPETSGLSPLVLPAHLPIAGDIDPQLRQELDRRISGGGKASPVGFFS